MGTFADWNKKLASSDFYDIQFEGFKGWDKEKDKYNMWEEPYQVSFQIIKGQDKSSREIAIEFDDISHGLFWTRDWTESGLPFVDGGEVYHTIFVFQFKEDWERFKGAFL